MKKNFATYATGIAMPNTQQQPLFLSIILSLLITSLLCSCSTSKNSISVTKMSSNDIVKNSTIVYASPNENNRIFGNITTKAGAPLKDVQIIFDNQNVALTDEKGNFDFNTKKTTGSIYQLIFSKEGYNKAVRNYTTEMNDANYNLTLIQPCKCDTTICNTCFLKNVSFNFEKETTTLSKENKTALDALIECLKRNPEKEIWIQHNTMFPKKAIASQRLETVLGYFTDNGIMRYRIKKEMIAEKNTVAKQIEIMSK
jgi:outer membrane protein OmpA-like peptidoglycan-associated protein